MSGPMYDQARTLHAGSKHGVLLWLALWRAGIRWRWLEVVLFGLVVATRVLLLALFVQAGLVKPWR